MNRSNIVRIAPAPTGDAMVVHEYETAHIRSDVPVRSLIRALAEHGLALRTDPALGLVIEPSEHHHR